MNELAERRTSDQWHRIPGDKRVATVISGRLSLNVGAPLPFDPQPIDEDFDEQAARWISRGEIDAACRIDLST